MSIPFLAFGLYFVGWEIYYKEFGSFFVVGILLTLVGGILLAGGIQKRNEDIPQAKCYFHADRDPVEVCYHCGKPLCEECLNKLEDHTYCAECNKEILEERTFVSQIPYKSKTIAILLCFFLWPLGLHRFYLGYSASGILYLITTFFAVILFISTLFYFLTPVIFFFEAVAAIIDLFKIACGKRKDIYGRKLI
ncbi:MAG: TM2 domain-containing protein [Clostridia bacterium]|nr:TM2 domain-containing protein [Clostridia bacterium]